MSPRFLADENIDPDLVVGRQRRVPGIDIIRVQEAGLRTQDDPTILGWAADHGRVLITRDIRTVPDYAHERVASGQGMPGVLVLPPAVSMGIAIDDVALIAMAMDPEELADRVFYLPLR